MTGERVEQRRQQLAVAPDLRALLATLQRRVAPLLERQPLIPAGKAQLSTDGGVCPDDRVGLVFDPWSPERHTCPRCGKSWSGERHHANWTRFQHLWIAERAVDMAMVAAFANDDAAARGARTILQAYGERYFSYPNRDNVLGPSRLFFSTYLESIWICSFLAAAVRLRASDALDEATERAVSIVAEEAANLIGEFDERFSNRQMWNNAALTAIAAWFGDTELAERVISGPTGLTSHLAYGFRGDGMWYEGENYHLFALRGLLTGFDWAVVAGTNLMANPNVRDRVGNALLAPALTALPDLTFPARKDSRFGVSLAQQMYLDTWEAGLAMLGPDAPATPFLAHFLRTLYAAPPTQPELFESFLHDAPLPALQAPARDRLSSFALIAMVITLPAADAPGQPASVLMEDQGLAVLRRADRYVSLEAGPWGGGHGHPDRLQLTLHAGGVHWLPDPGTGSYVEDELSWYRSSLAHNAPRLDGRSQTAGRATCERFINDDPWSWALGHFRDLARTVVTGPDYVVDVVELTGTEERLLELPWHLAGDVEVVGARWMPGELDNRFVSDVEQLVRAATGPIVLRARAGDAQLAVHLVFTGDLLRMRGPGLPNRAPDRPAFFVARARGKNLRMVAVLETTPGTVRQVRTADDIIEIVTSQGTDRHRSGEAWVIETPQWRGTLRGGLEPTRDYAPLLELEPPERAHGLAFRLAEAPALDGTPDGFPFDEPLSLDLEDQYRRSEEPYPGPEELSATAAVAWDEEALYVCVEIVKPELVFRPADAPPLRLDKDPDDIHSDGIQVYLGDPEGDDMAGVLVVPESSAGGGLRIRPVSGTTTDVVDARGGWQTTDTGYRVTLALPWPAAWARVQIGGRVGFDLIINEMLPGRQRRAGQLAWSGGNGWVWLRGDGQAKERLGELELVG